MAHVVLTIGIDTGDATEPDLRYLLGPEGAHVPMVEVMEMILRVPNVEIIYVDHDDVSSPSPT